MDRKELLERLKSIISDTLDIESSLLSELSTANDFEEWDSLGHIQLVVAIEKAFKIRFSSLEIIKWKNVGEIIDSIQEKLESGSKETQEDRKLVVRVIWSDTITPTEIEDFRYVTSRVFGPYCTMDYFRRKYIDNIYGPSLLYIAYLDGQPVGADALWRNDINGERAYYSADTCVIHSCDAQSVFGAITRAKQEFATENDAILYAFPNQNSFTGFKGMGWNVKVFYKHLFFPLPIICKVPHVDEKFAVWWLKFRKSLRSHKLFGRYYLVKRTSKKRVCILGSVDKETAMAFPCLEEFYGLFYYYLDKIGYYGKRSQTKRMVSYNPKQVTFDVWKTDWI